MRVLWFLLLIVIIGCTNNNRPIVDRNIVTGTDSIPDFKSDFMSEETYVWPLPVGSSRDDRINEDHFVRVPGDIQNLFSLSGSITDPCMVRFPDHKGYKVVAVSYTNPEGYEVTELYTLDPEWVVYDHLQVESVEPLEPYELLIVQEYEIDDNYGIIETKYINDLVIEQLTYEITDKGLFAEIRDGKHRVIAYDMFDNTDQFVVESFIWNVTPEGALSKKDFSQTNYDLKRLEN